jgi:hypothetical protein
VLRLRLIPSLFAASLLVACTGDDSGDGGDDQASEGDEGDGLHEQVKLFIDSDASSVCSSGTGSVELVTRRVDCWDPQLPCTLAQNPPWVVGTTRDCGSISGVSRWEVTVSQTGRWQTRLQSTEAIQCVGVGGEARTNVARDDLASRAEFMLSGAPSGQCGEL